MAQGASTPIEVRIAGKNYNDITVYANKLLNNFNKIDFLRDVQLKQPQDFPVINISVDRFKLAQMGLSLQDIARSVTDATSSSRFTEKTSGSILKFLTLTRYKYKYLNIA